MTTILYLNIIPGDSIHALTLAGIRRYAATLGWVAAAVRVSARPADPPRRRRGADPLGRRGNCPNGLP